MSGNKLFRSYLASYLTIFVTVFSLFSGLKELIKSEFVRGVIFGILSCLILISVFIDVLEYLKLGESRNEEI